MTAESTPIWVVIAERVRKSIVLLRTAARPPYDLVLGSRLVHTSEWALSSGVQGIAEIGEGFRASDKL